MSQFIPMTGLDNLTEEEKRQYYENSCAYFGVPLELNLLQFIWMYTEGGNDEKHLVLYAKRGATDIMRANQGICVDEITQTITEGFITFTAKGHDKTGRTDVAVGAASIKNLTGRALSNEIMTAQTRATRRLTLQLVGGGLLDESEVQLTPTAVVSSSQPAGQVAALPTVTPNAAPGKDITEQSKAPIPAAIQAEEKRAMASLFSLEPPFEVKGITKATQDGTVTIPPVEKKRRRRRSSAVVLDSPSIDISPLPVESPKADIPESKHTPTPEELEEMEIQELRAKQAARRAEAAKPVVQEAVVPNLGTPDPKPVTEAPLPPKPPMIGNLPKEEQMRDFKTRLFVYTNDVLRKGNMKGCEGIGGIEYKMRAFVKLMIPNSQDTKSLTVDQWNTFLGYLDTKLAEFGPEGLVQHINQKIGAKE
jgi:hypothetical protein